MSPPTLSVHSEDELIRRVRYHVQIVADTKTPLAAKTEIYKDLGVSGDDLYELIVGIRKEFGTDFSKMKLRRYAPGEADFDWLPWPLQHRRKYESLTIGALEEAVANGRWEDRVS